MVHGCRFNVGKEKMIGTPGGVSGEIWNMVWVLGKIKMH